MPKSSAPACSAPTPALGSHPLKQSPQQPSSWCLLGACCIPRLQAGRYVLLSKLAPSLCFLLRSRYLLHRLQGSNERPVAPPSASALYRPLPYHFCRGAEEGCCRKSLPLWCFPRREASFIRSVQRTAMSRPQPIRIRGKVREADSLPDTRVTYRFI